MTNFYFLQLHRLEVQDWGTGRVRFLMRALFLIHRRLPCYTLTLRRERELWSLHDFIKAPISSHGLHPYDLITPQRCDLQIPFTLGIRASV